MPSYLQDFLSYLEASPCVYHAAKETGMRLAENDFEPLVEHEDWHLEKSKSYFLIKDESAVIAFKMPKKAPKKAMIIASHLDSPALKIRPDFTSPSADTTQLGVEIYGGPILNTWFNVDLAVAGRIVYTDGKDKMHSKLIDFRDFPLIMPQLPIHLDREVNDKGLQLNKQDHLRPIFSFSKVDFMKALKEHSPFDKLLAYDLFLYPLQSPRLIGHEHEMIASYRLDNLSSAHAALWAIIEAEADDDVLPIAVFWDHEEIGSKSHIGADSALLLDVMERISGFYQMPRKDFIKMKSSSFCLSVDVAQGFHPNYPAKFDTQFTPVLGKGITLKYSAGQKYTNSAYSCAALQKLCQKKKLPLQKFVARNDNPSGSTVGPVMAATLSMRTLDIGVPLLAMHATREVISAKDQESMMKVLKAALESKELFFHE